MMRSTPVADSSARIFLPIRPIILPFISSLGRDTTLTVFSVAWSAAQRCIAVTIMFCASLTAFSRASASMAFASAAAPFLTSSRSAFLSSSSASSLVIPATLSSSPRRVSCERLSSSSMLFSLSRLSSRDFWAFSSSSVFLSRVSSFLDRLSSRLSSAVSFCSRRLSVRCHSDFFSLVSRSNSERNLFCCSFASRSPSLRIALASKPASSRIRSASLFARPILFLEYDLYPNSPATAPASNAPITPRTTPTI